MKMVTSTLINGEDNLISAYKFTSWEVFALSI